MTLQQAASHAPGAGTGQGFGSAGYRNYVLFMLTFAYTLNFIDRILIGVVAEPIIKEFQLADWQFGILSGFGFAVLYTVAGIPIARLAEKYNRVRIIAVSVIVWSLMTALCGLAGGFISLLVFRVGVGIGEAGCTPPANSIISDYFPPRSRARAFAIYALGITLGSVFANLFGGPIAENFSWRDAFLMLGLPGVLVGIVIWFTMKEPPRGYSEPASVVQSETAPSISDVLRSIVTNRTYLLNGLAATIVAFVGYGVTAFQAPFFQRVYGLSVGEVATTLVLPLSLAAAAGTFSAGLLTEKLSGKFPSIVAWLPGLGLGLAIPLYWFGYHSTNLQVTFWLLFAGAFCHYSYLGAQYTICQAVVDIRARATALAIMLFVVNLIGYGVGPLFIGILSDYFAQGQIASSAFAGDLALTTCKGANLAVTLGEAKAAVCQAATSEGLRGSLATTILLFAIGSTAFLLASRTLYRDVVSKIS